jgi:hypothetical protein
MLENAKVAIKNGQSTETSNMGNTRRKKQNKNTTCKQTPLAKLVCNIIRLSRLDMRFGGLFKIEFSTRI